MSKKDRLNKILIGMKPIIDRIDYIMKTYVTFWTFLSVSLVLFILMEKLFLETSIGWVGTFVSIIYAITIVYWTLKLQLWRNKELAKHLGKLVTKKKGATDSKGADNEPT